MKKTKLTRSLLAACSIVALSAVMYGCAHTDSGPSQDELDAANAGHGCGRGRGCEEAAEWARPMAEADDCEEAAEWARPMAEADAADAADAQADGRG